MEKQVAHEVLLDELEKATHPHAPSGRLRFLAYIIAGIKFPEEAAEKVRLVLNNLMQSSTSGNVQAHMAVFPTMRKWQYVWQKQIKKKQYTWFFLLFPTY